MCYLCPAGCVTYVLTTNTLVVDSRPQVYDIVPVYTESGSICLVGNHTGEIGIDRRDFIQRGL